MKAVMLQLVIVILAASALANDVYLAQTPAGGSTGADCADALAYTYFNSRGNWTGGGPTGTQIGPGTTVHLCGTFTAPAGAANYLVFQGSGGLGKPIVLEFEAGAVLTSASWSGAVISLDSQSYVTVNGGVNGAIQATANGTGLAHQAGGGVCVSGSGGGNIVIENLTCSDIYVHACTPPTSSCTDENQYGAAFSFTNTNNLQVSNNTVHDLHWAVIYCVTSGGYGVFQVNGNNIYNVDHGIIPCIGNGSTGTITSVYIFNNHIHDLQAWDDAADGNHHDPVHAFTFSGGTLAHVFVYNNLLDGNWGTNTNSGVYMEGPDEGGAITSCYIFNNVMNPSAGGTASGGIADYSSNGCASLNNTILGLGIVVGYTTSGGATFYNNIVTGKEDSLPEVMGDGHGGRIAASDYNAFALLPRNGNGFVGSKGGCCEDLALWRLTRFDTHAVASSRSGQGAVSYLKFNSSTYVPNAGSPLIGRGKNLSLTCRGQPNPGLGALCFDAAGIFRQSWGIGAFGPRAASPAQASK